MKKQQMMPSLLGVSLRGITTYQKTRVADYDFSKPCSCFEQSQTTEDLKKSARSFTNRNVLLALKNPRVHIVAMQFVAKHPTFVANLKNLIY